MRPVILTFTGHYLPGYKAGGILHNLVNTVNSLCHEFDFWIITRDRDLGDDAPYSNIHQGQWKQLGNAMVYYLPAEELKLEKIKKLIADTRHDLLYFTSLFEAFTVKALFCRRLNLIPNKPVIVEPNGEFGWASLKQKYLKKILFLQTARVLGIYNGVIWRAAGKAEQEDILRYMKPKQENVRIAAYMPEEDMQNKHVISGEEEPHNANDMLKIIFLSRIAPEKNLDYALKILSAVKSQVIFDIYGPIENEGYWKKCQKSINQLPDNVKVQYRGKVEHNEVPKVFSRYDLFFFPSAGEAYGMVIAESLAAGTTVLISDKTAFTDLQSDDLGWDISLRNVDEFVRVIDHYASWPVKERLKKRILVKNNIEKRLFDPGIFKANLMLFHEAIQQQVSIETRSRI